jgi:hypothetical protein
LRNKIKTLNKDGKAQGVAMFLVKTLIKYSVISILSISLAFFAATQYLGLKMVSAVELASLRVAQSALNNLRAHNNLSKQNLTRKMSAKAGKRLSTTMVAASTLGTVLVVAASTKFLMDDYCDEMESLLTIESIMEAKEVTFNTNECLLSLENDVETWIEEAARGTTTILAEGKDKVTENIVNALGNTKKSINDFSTSFMKSLRGEWSKITSQAAEFFE